MKTNIQKKVPKILVVDDSLTNLKLMEGILSFVDAIVFTANNSRDALKHVLESKFSVILLDIMMPQMDGFELAMHIRESDLNKTSPILFITAVHADENLKMEAYEAGAIDFIQKPFNNVVLLSKVKIFLELYNRELIQENLTQQLLEKNKQLEIEIAERKLASKAKDDFLASMSHEIRTPMNGVLGMTDLLLKTKLNKQQQKKLETIHHSGKTLLRIINDILDFSKIQSGKYTIDAHEFNLNEVIKNINKIFKQKHKNKHIKFTIKRDKNIHLALIGDSQRLNQILYNLLGNAFKFTHQGKISLTISKLEESSNDIKLYFTIYDTGIGISKDFQEHIFNAFRQADGTITRKYGGTGLGLVISKKLAELMGGELNFESIEEKGSTFYFSCNFAKQKRTKKNVQNTSLRNSKSVSTNRKYNVPILLVEDNKVNQDVAIGMLKLFGCQIDVVENGEQALTKLVQNAQKNTLQYKLVFMDCEMPIKDGFQATSEWRIYENQNKLTHLPIIALTAHALESSRQNALYSGMDDFLRKPFSEQHMVNMLDKWIVKDVIDERYFPFKIEEQKVAIPITPAILSDSALDQLRQLEASGAKGIVDRMIHHYLQQAPEQLKLIIKGLKTKDAKLIRINAHSLKSSSATLGAMELSKLFKAIELDYKQQTQIKEHLKQVKSCFNKTCHALKLVQLKKG
ncbi:MAG: response regulator [Pseudomonadota bacterium]